MTKNEAHHISTLFSTRKYTDYELVQGMKNNDPHIRMAFFNAYNDQINKMVWKLLRSPNDHNDMVNTVFVEILKSIKKLKDPQTLPNWVHVITINTVRTEIRKQQLRRHVFANEEEPEKYLAPSTPTPEDIFGRVYAIIRTMKPKNQIVFVLRFIEAYTVDEIAKMQGCSRSTCKRHVNRGKTEFLKKAKRDLVLACFIKEVEEDECI